MKKLFSLFLVIAATSVSAQTPGALSGLFSVSSSKKVRFSQGNLQYQASTNTWRFASNQYDCIGDSNTNISSTYSGWIDLFGWGTSGWNSGATCYQPYSTCFKNADYYVGGSATKGLTGTYSRADWGVYNAISNGGNKANLWRTLSYEEWDYLLSTRTNASSKYGVGTINGVNGLIILPDSWTLPQGVTFKSGNASNTGAAYYKTVNNYTLAQWAKMEANGAVFLPAAGERGSRSSTMILPVGEWGYYWSTTTYSTQLVYLLEFSAYSSPITGGNRYSGASVRLVQNSTVTVSYTLTTVANPTAGGTVTAGGTIAYHGTKSLTATPAAGYRFIGWTISGTGSTLSSTTATTTTFTMGSANATVTANFEEISMPRYTITFNANGGLIPTDGNMGNTPSGHITTLSTDRTSGTVVVTKDKTYFQTMTNDCPSREGYTFAGWYTDPTSGVQVYDNTGYRVVGTYWNNEGKWIGTSNVTLYAHWTPIPYTITVNPSNVSQGSATGGGTYDYDTNHQISATPNECYRFVQWSDGNTDNPRTIIVTGDATYTAEFEQIQYTIEAQSADAGQGSAIVTNP